MQREAAGLLVLCAHQSSAFRLMNQKVLAMQIACPDPPTAGLVYVTNVPYKLSVRTEKARRSAMPKNRARVVASRRKRPRSGYAGSTFAGLWRRTPAGPATATKSRAEARRRRETYGSASLREAESPCHSAELAFAVIEVVELLVAFCGPVFKSRTLLNPG